MTFMETPEIRSGPTHDSISLKPGGENPKQTSSPLGERTEVKGKWDQRDHESFSQMGSSEI